MDYTYKAKVLKIVDGDTIDVEGIGRIRMADINAPELSTKEGQKAKEFVKSLCLGKTVYLDIDDEKVVGKYGRDVLRFALLRSDPANDFYFSWREMSSVYKFFTILMNVYNYFATYCTYEKLDESVLKEEDKWLLSKFNSLLKAVLYECKRYHGYRALQLIEKFVVEDLSRWYVKLVRDRNDRGVSAVLSYVLENLLIKLPRPVLVGVGKRGARR